MTTATVIISAAYREGNIIAAGATPTSAEQTEALERLNRLVTGLYGAEMGEELTDWLIPAPQRTAAYAANYPQLPYPTDTSGDIFPLPFSEDPTVAIYPYAPKNSRIVFGNVTNTLYFPESPQDGTRMSMVAGSGAGDSGAPGTATGVLTMTALPTATHTVTVGTKDGTAAAVYKWVAAVVAAFDVLIGTSIEACVENLAQAVNAGEGSGTLYGPGTTANNDVTAGYSPANGTVTVTAVLDGTGGNSIASTTTDGGSSWGASTLAGGTTGAILTLDGNGRLIEGSATQAYECPIQPRSWLYRADLGNWVAVLDMTLTDQMPFPSELDDLFICLLAIRLCPRYTKAVPQATSDLAARMLKTFKARYRQAGVTVYGSEGFPRSLQSYISGRWWW